MKKVSFIKCSDRSKYELKKDEIGGGAIIFIEDTKEIIIDGVTYIQKPVIMKNIVVSVFTNITDVTEDPYNYYADIIADVTSNDFVNIVFNTIDAISGNLSPVCETFDGYIRIWSKTADPITIKTIIIQKL